MRFSEETPRSSWKLSQLRASDLRTEQLQQALETAGQPLAENENAQSLGESLQNGDFSGASAAAAQLADTLSSLTPEEQAKLAEDLAATAEALAETDPELAQGPRQRSVRRPAPAGTGHTRRQPEWSTGRRQTTQC